MVPAPISICGDRSSRHFDMFTFLRANDSSAVSFAIDLLRLLLHFFLVFVECARLKHRDLRFDKIIGGTIFETGGQKAFEIE